MNRRPHVAYAYSMGNERSVARCLRRGRGGFSLLEMMVAIIILGMGLLMAATMFPVGWMRARDLAEFTTQTTAANTAATTVRLLCNVADPAGTTDPTTSFLGDFDPAVFNAGGPGAGIGPDPTVHVLHLENALADPDALPATGEIAWPEAVTFNAVDPANPDIADYRPVDPTMNDWMAAGMIPPGSQIAFHERLIPPLPLRPVVPPATPQELDQWNSMLASRRFAWAVLYKFDQPLPMSAGDSRSMTFYFVTLRRTQSTHRFARQDPQGNPPPLPDLTTKPRALGPLEDMLFPVPWLINLKIEGNWDSISGDPNNPTGVPSEAVANPGANSDARLIARMLQPGSVLIDRLTGNIFTVKQHRFTGSGNQFDFQATVTLDREINISDIGLAAAVQIDVPVSINPAGDLRDFWVFPPPVLADRPEQGFVTYDGRQPVAAIETRQMYFSP